MAVAHDASSENESSAVASSSWTHTPTGTPRGVLAFVVSNSSTPIETGVTYGGVALSAVSGAIAADTSGEAGACQAWFLGSSVPTGAQTVQVNRANTAARVWTCLITVTASDNTEVTGVLLEQETQTLTEENVNDGSPGSNSVRYMGLFSGFANTASLTDGANSTRLQDTNFGGTSRVGLAMRETTAGQGARPVGVDAASDDVAAVYLAIREVTGGGGFTGAARVIGSGGWSSPFSGLVVR